MKKIREILSDNMPYIIVIFSIVLIYGISVSFRHFENIWLSVIILLTILMPGSGRIRYKQYYVSADNKDISNPLFVRGYFRKNEKKSIILSELKGIYYCQVVALIVTGIIVIYWGIAALVDFRNHTIENCFLVLSIVVFFVFGAIITFYKCKRLTKKCL